MSIYTQPFPEASKGDCVNVPLYLLAEGFDSVA